MPKVRTPNFKLTIGTHCFNDAPMKQMVKDIVVEQESDGASSFTVMLDDALGTFSNGKKQIVEGNSCVIELGYYEGGTTKLIEGIVTGVKSNRSEHSRNLFVVTGFDGLQALTRGRKRRSWEKIKDSDLASKIANECGLQPDVDDSGIVHPYVVQNNVNNLTFLKERAKRIGYEVKVVEKRLVFKKPQRTNGDPVATLSWPGPNTDTSTSGITILQRCDFNTSTMNVVKKVIVRGYDPKTAKAIIGTAEQIDGDKMGGSRNAGDAAAANNPDTTIQISDSPVASQEEAEKLAQSILDQRAGDYLTGKGKCEGNGKVACGNKIAIKDVGKELDGEYYVTTSKHSLKLGQGRGCGYWTEFTVSRTGH